MTLMERVAALEAEVATLRAMVVALTSKTDAVPLAQYRHTTLPPTYKGFATSGADSPWEPCAVRRSTV